MKGMVYLMYLQGLGNPMKEFHQLAHESLILS